MSDTFTFNTTYTTEIFDRFSEELGSYLTDPGTAKAGQICGFKIETKSEPDPDGYALSFPIEDFIISLGDGKVDLKNFKDLDAETQQQAAMLAMWANLTNPARMGGVRDAFNSLDDHGYALYASMLVLPSLILIYEDQYPDLIDIDPEDPAQTQDMIDLYFHLLRHKKTSHHQSIAHYQQEIRDFALLCDLAPLVEDFFDPSSPRLQMTLQN